MMAREQLQHRVRKRANSKSTEVPAFSGDTPIESFGKEVVVDGVRFTTVKLFPARRGSFCHSLNSTSLTIYIYYRGAWDGVHG